MVAHGFEYEPVAPRFHLTVGIPRVASNPGGDQREVSGSCPISTGTSCLDQVAEVLPRQLHLLMDLLDPQPLVVLVQERVAELIAEVAVVADFPHQSQEVAIVGNR